jgi:hypothetical protein
LEISPRTCKALVQAEHIDSLEIAIACSGLCYTNGVGSEFSLADTEKKIRLNA